MEAGPSSSYDPKQVKNIIVTAMRSSGYMMGAYGRIPNR